MKITEKLDRSVGMPERKRIFLVDSVTKRAGQVAQALSSMYSVTTFEDGGKTLEAMHKNPPDLVIIDEKTMTNHGQGIHKTKVHDARLKHIPFIIMSNVTEGELMFGDGEGAKDQFLKRPLNFKSLLEYISFSLSYAVEQSWQKTLPKSATKTLTSTVTQFKSITQAITNGEPLGLKETNAACRPLVECIQAEEFKGVLDGLRNHHNYTYVHSLRVATYLTLFGKAMGMGENELLMLSSGGMLHDVGKITMPQTLLNKPGKLDDEEWVVMRDHVVQSNDIIVNMPDANPVIRIIAEQHHEKVDGTGYPHGLKGGELNELARMATIVDIYGALTDKRSYKPAFDLNKSFAILQDMGAGLDQRLVTKFREVVIDTA